MKTTKKLLVLLLTLVLAFSMLPSVFAQTTSDEVVCDLGETFEVTFLVENIAGINGRLSASEFLTLSEINFEGLTEGAVIIESGALALVGEEPADFTLTAKFGTDAEASIPEQELFVTFTYQTTTDGYTLSEEITETVKIVITMPVTVDTRALEEALALAEAVLNGTSNYTETSLANLRTAYNAGLEALTSDSQETVDAATKAIWDAIDALLLESGLDYTELKELLMLVDEWDEADYTAASWANFDQVRAVSRLAMTYAETQEEVDTAVANLKAAVAALVKVKPEPTVNYAALNDAIASAEAKKEADYTAESWSALKTALEAAKAALKSNDQTVVDAAAAELKAATDALVAVKAPVDYTALKAAIAAADALKATDYTNTSWVVMRNAYTMAQGALYAPDQATVDAAAAALTEAVSKLVKMDLTALQAAIDAAKAYQSPNQDSDLWKSLTDLLAAAELLKTSGDQAKVNAAAASINDLLNTIKEEDARQPITTPVIETPTLNPSDDSLFNILFWVLIALLIAAVVAIGAYLIIVLVVKKNGKDDTPVVNYDIRDDDK